MRQFDFLSDGTVFKFDIFDNSPSPSTLRGESVKTVILTLKEKILIFCFEVSTVENYAFLEWGFSKRLEMKTTFAP